MPIKDKRGRKQEQEGRAFQPHSRSNTHQRKKGKRLGRKSQETPGSFGKVSARWTESLSAKLPIRRVPH